MNYKNQVVSKDLSLTKIKPIFTNVIIIIIAKGKIKIFKRKGVIYIILIISKHEILPKLRELRSIYLIILSFA